MLEDNEDNDRTASSRPNDGAALAPSSRYRSAGKIALKITQIGQGVGEQRLQTCARRAARRSRPSVQRRVRCHPRRRRSCFAQANEAMPSSDTCWAAAQVPGTHHPARKFARCARAEAPSLSLCLVNETAYTMIRRPLEACMASRNAACLSQARWCVDAGHLVDYVQCVGARADAVGKSLSLEVVNPS